MAVAHINIAQAATIYIADTIKENLCRAVWTTATGTDYSGQFSANVSATVE